MICRSALERAKRELVFKARLEKLSKKEAVPNDINAFSTAFLIYVLMLERGGRHG